MSLSRAAVIVLAAVALLVAPSTASAIDGWERRLSAGPINDQPFKSATAFCTPGKRVIGGGAAVHGNRKRVRLVGLVPSAVGFTAVAEAPDHFSSYDWHVTAYVICSDAPELLRSTYQIIRGHVDVSRGRAVRAHRGVLPERHDRLRGGRRRDRQRAQHPELHGRQDRSPAEPDNGTQTRPFLCPRAVRGHAQQLAADVVRDLRRAVGADERPRPARGGRGGTRLLRQRLGCERAGWWRWAATGRPVWLRHIVPQASVASVIVRLTGPLYPSIGGMVAQTTCGL